jgi:hypothetical protein
MNEAGSPKRKIGAVELQAAIRWNDPRRPQARESFGAVPAVTPVGRGASVLNGFPSPGGRDGIRLSGIFSGHGAEIRAEGAMDRKSMGIGDNLRSGLVRSHTPSCASLLDRA